MRERQATWLHASWIGFVVVAMAAACGWLGHPEDSTAAISQALEPVSNTSDALEMTGLLGRPGGMIPGAFEGFRCDQSPDITFVDVCGRNMPATVHLEWTDCPPPPPPGMLPDGGMLPWPPDGGLPPLPDGGLPPFPGPRPLPDGGLPPPPPPLGPSSGVVDFANSYGTPNGCTGAVSVSQHVTFTTDRDGPEGIVFSVGGSADSSLTLQPGVRPDKTTTFDATRSVTDSSGNVLRSVHLTGNLHVAFSSDIPPDRITNGQLHAEFSDDTASEVELTDVVRPAPLICHWPISGTVERTGRDGITHTLVYGPACGQATLDGNPITLPEMLPPRPRL